MKTLTISIAAYNVERYLEQTLQSLSDPRYIHDLEVLIVDDGSTDKTGDIALEYQTRFPDTFIYVKKENGGHGSTINKGVELASGKYFRVIDGDDYVDQDEFHSFMQKLGHADQDLILTNLCAVNDRGIRRLDPAMLKNGKDVFDKVIENRTYIVGDVSDTRIFGLSTMTVKTNLLKRSNLFITENCFYVDAEYVIWCIYLAKNFVFWDYRVYMYRKDDSNDNSVNKKNMLKNISMQEKVSANLLKLYRLFCDCGIRSNKRKLILKRIEISVGAAMRTYMLLKDHKEAKGKIMSFDNRLKEADSEAYRDLSDNWFIRAVRFCSYSFVPLICEVYKRWIRR